jgi:hypothetical protein
VRVVAAPDHPHVDQRPEDDAGAAALGGSVPLDWLAIAVIVAANAVVGRDPDHR